MSGGLAHRLMTVDEMLALPDDGMDRELIRGELREKPMTMRNRRHSATEGRLARLLGNWLLDQPEPRGEIVAGEAGFRLQHNPESGVGIDVAYVSAEVASRSPNAAYFEGAPILAVEILSPSDVQAAIDEKIELYLESGVAVVWVVNTTLRTVAVYRKDSPPLIFGPGQVLATEPELPGLSIAIDSIV